MLDYALENFAPPDVLKESPIRYVEDIAALEHRPPVLERLLAEGMRSVLTIPLIVKGELIGELDLDEVRQHQEWRSIPIVVVTAMDLTPDDRRRLNGYVEQILHKGVYSREVLLREIRDLVAACLRAQRPGLEEDLHGEDLAGRR